jgi:hypothetical protein
MQSSDELTRMNHKVVGLQHEFDTSRNQIRSRVRAGRRAEELRRELANKAARLALLLRERNAVLVSQRKASADEQ